MKASEVFAALTTSRPLPLYELEERFGVYALWDHDGRIRYIGCTPKATEGFRTRVANKHVTGSEGRSHKFSQAYCVGRMWRYTKRLYPTLAVADQSEADAREAKKLRNLFIRRYCRATTVELPINYSSLQYFAELTALEFEIQAMAPACMRAWEGVYFRPDLEEPTVLVDALLADYPFLSEATERQKALFMKYVYQTNSGKEGREA